MNVRQSVLMGIAANLRREQQVLHELSTSSSPEDQSSLNRAWELLDRAEFIVNRLSKVGGPP
jgi:hypothetical protein